MLQSILHTNFNLIYIIMIEGMTELDELSISLVYEEWTIKILLIAIQP